MNAEKARDFLLYNRDLSWLSFNRRVMQEAADASVGLADRIKFLAIFSANLDEFYSVRMPVMMALQKLEKENAVEEAQELILAHMREFGSILENQVLPLLKANHVHLLYHEPVPSMLHKNLREYLYNRVLGYLSPIFIRNQDSIWVENNKLYLLVLMNDPEKKPVLAIVNVPTEHLPRFYFADAVDQEERIIVFLEDVIRSGLDIIFKGFSIQTAYSFKVTRNAALDLESEFKGGLARKLEKKLKMRAFAPPSRLLYEPGIPQTALEELVQKLNLRHAGLVQGGHYHNLKDLSGLPLPSKPVFLSETWQPKKNKWINTDPSIFEQMDKRDLMIHTPYQSYHPVLRFFNEAAIDPDVRAIHLTIYRVATDSQIMNALISAARNGKKVVVFVELKARFDEANNLSWSKKMKSAGIRIVYSRADLKVHSKIALVKARRKESWTNYALLSTGNLNESTARVYTDHILLTSNPAIAKELGSLFKWLGRKDHSAGDKQPAFEQLLVSPFNLQKKFLQCIDAEIAAAQSGQPAWIHIKMNNLEEKNLIGKLYEASRAGVKIRLIVRGICCLLPGVPGMSDNIVVTRIVDRFLEHGRVFIFSNGGNPRVYSGSSDWMERNIHRRIEVCFPIHDEFIRQELVRLINLQLSDNVRAVVLDEKMNNIPIEKEAGTSGIRSQQMIYDSL